jgi:hypothetical protein
VRKPRIEGFPTLPLTAYAYQEASWLVPASSVCAAMTAPLHLLHEPITDEGLVRKAIAKVGAESGGIGRCMIRYYLYICAHGP